MPVSWQHKLSSGLEVESVLLLHGGGTGSELEEVAEEQSPEELTEPAEEQAEGPKHKLHPGGEVEVAAEAQAGSDSQWSTATSVRSCSGVPRKPPQKQPREAEVAAGEQEEASKRAKPRGQPQECRRGARYFQQQASREQMVARHCQPGPGGSKTFSWAQHGGRKGAAKAALAFCLSME